MKNWIANLFAESLQVVFRKFGKQVILLGDGDSALVFDETGEVSSLISQKNTEGAHASKSWVVVLNWGFTGFAGDNVFETLMTRFHEHFNADPA